MGDVLRFRKERVREVHICTWEPVPLEMGRYRCSGCGVFGYRDQGSGLVVPHRDGGRTVLVSIRDRERGDFLKGMYDRDRSRMLEYARLLDTHRFPDPRHFKWEPG